MNPVDDAKLPFGPRLGEVIQYAYAVADIDSSIAIYVDRFGVGPWFKRGPFTPPQARYLGATTGLTITLARAFAGDTMIELIQQHDNGPSVYRKVIDAGYGFHHWAVGSRDADVDIARFAEFGYPVVFEDLVPSGARVVYVDATSELPGMIEILEMNDIQRELYAGFHRASVDWDGSDPVRIG
jgi:Glyoxalase/Bleomycin resistance protein/Dioxygenase superfamily